MKRQRTWDRDLCLGEEAKKDEKFPHTRKPLHGQGWAELRNLREEHINRSSEGRMEMIHHRYHCWSATVCKQSRLFAHSLQWVGVGCWSSSFGGWTLRRWLGLSCCKDTLRMLVWQLRESRENHGLAREARDHCYGNTLTTHSQNAGPHLCQCHRWDESAAVYKGSKDTARARGRGQEATAVLTSGLTAVTKLRSGTSHCSYLPGNLCNLALLRDRRHGTSSPGETHTPPQTVATDGRTPSYLCEKLSGYERMRAGWTRTSWNICRNTEQVSVQIRSSDIDSLIHLFICGMTSNSSRKEKADL